MMENALSILIVIFSVQLQQTEISDRKLFIFQHGTGLVHIYDKYFVRNLTLHHFLLSPEVWNICVSINFTVTS